MTSPSMQFARNLQRFRLITFDITDTLLRLSRPPGQQYAIIAKEFGLQNIDEDALNNCFLQRFKIMDKQFPNFGYATPKMSWEQWWIQLVEQVFQCADKELPTDKLNKLALELLRIYRTPECWTLIENALQIVEQMRDAGKCIGVISNFDPSLNKILKEMNLLDKFDFVLTSYEAGFAKPNTKIFQKSLEKCRVQPHEALHIGNKYEMDYVGARNSGWAAVLVTENIKNNCAISAEYTFGSIKHLKDALETKNIIW